MGPFDGGIYTIGHEGGGFGYDNEYPSHKTYLEAFQNKFEARDERRIHGIHGRRRLRERRAMALRGLGQDPVHRVECAVLLGK